MFLRGSSPLPFFSHGRDLAEVLRPSLGGRLPAFRSQDSSGLYGEKIVSQGDGSSQEFAGTLGSALGQDGGGEDQFGFADEVAKRAEIGLWFRHASRIRQPGERSKRLLFRINAGLGHYP